MTSEPEEPDWASYPYRAYVGASVVVGFKIVICDADTWVTTIPDEYMWELCNCVGSGRRIEVMSMRERDVEIVRKFLKSKIDLCWAQPWGTA